MLSIYCYYFLLVTAAVITVFILGSEINQFRNEVFLTIVLDTLWVIHVGDSCSSVLGNSLILFL